MPEPVIEDALDKFSDQQLNDDMADKNNGEEDEEGTINYDDDKFEQDEEEEEVDKKAKDAPDDAPAA